MKFSIAAAVADTAALVVVVAVVSFVFVAVVVVVLTSKYFAVLNGAQTWRQSPKQIHLSCSQQWQMEAQNRYTPRPW